MPRDTVTSLDVARLAGVSQSAVSRVFTPGASASQHTSDKVREAANKLGYRPNSLARAMVSGRSRIIGLVVAYLDNQFYPDALEKLSARLQGRGYHVLVFLTTRTQGDITSVIEEILDYQVDGIIAASVALSSDLSDRCRVAGVPLVLFNRSQDDAALSSVTSDNYAGGRKAAEVLIAGGHRRIAYIAGWEGASTQRDREAGFTAALSDAGLNLHARALVISAPTGRGRLLCPCFLQMKYRMRSLWPMIIWPFRFSTRCAMNWVCVFPKMYRSLVMMTCWRHHGPAMI